MPNETDRALALLKAQREFNQGFHDDEQMLELFGHRLSTSGTKTVFISTPSLGNSWLEKYWFLEKNHGS